MSYQHDRDEFIARMAKEGLSLAVARKLLAGATTMQRYAELACSSEAADRDRVPCPASRPNGHSTALRDCLCDQYHGDGQHETVPRIDVLNNQLKWRLAKALPPQWAINTQGDPRGYVLRVIPPSYSERNRGRVVHDLETIGVPPGPTRVRF